MIAAQVTAENGRLHALHYEETSAHLGSILFAQARTKDVAIVAVQSFASTWCTTRLYHMLRHVLVRTVIGRRAHLMVQIIEKGLIDDSGEGGTNAAGLHALLYNNALTRLLDALCDGLQVEGLQTDQVDHLHNIDSRRSSLAAVTHKLSACMTCPAVRPMEEAAKLQ